MHFSRKEFLKAAGILAGSSFTGLDRLISSAAHPLVKPQRLKKGDTIGMISPASSLTAKKKYIEVAETIEKLGFNVKTGLHAKDRYGYLAGTDEDRAADLNAMFADNDVNAILPFRGGWGSNRILEYIDFDEIEKNPKPLIGFSDITSLLLAIYAKTGLVTFHGPVGKSKWTPFTKSYFNKALMQATTFTMQNDGNEEGITVIRKGTASGTLLGGNLSVLTSMLGSTYLPDWQNALLFLEDVGEDIYRIDRMLTQLRLNGVFDKINGLIFGRCTTCEMSSGPHFTLEQILENHIKDYNIPAFTGARIGHIDDMFTVPIGIGATMNAENRSITLLETAVK